MYVNEHRTCLRNLGTPGTHPFELLQTAPFHDHPQRPIVHSRLRRAPVTLIIFKYYIFFTSSTLAES
jgi:hypothetical protein